MILKKNVFKAAGIEKMIDLFRFLTPKGAAIALPLEPVLTRRVFVAKV